MFVAIQVDARKDAQFRVTAVESHDWKAILMIHSALILAMCVAGVAAVFSAHVALAAQSRPSAFEVISVRRGSSGTFPVGPEPRPGGTFVSTNVALDRVIRFAFNLPDYQIAGGPAWVRDDAFDIEAKAGRDVPEDEVRRMVQALLADRFRLVVRREQRDMSIYTLVLARADRRLGSNLRQSPADCSSPDGSKETTQEQRTANGGVATRRTCAPMARLISSLSSALQSPVRDQTGLTGMWDSELSFTGERRRNTDPATAARDPNDAPALLTAVEEQLGLKLEPARGPVEVLVIDSVERPTPD
jgi:uncharacterized protein (TIGR03435 family)